MPKKDSLIDFRRMSFPSDTLTLGRLRREHAVQFDDDVSPSFFKADTSGPSADRILGTMLYVERMIASLAFDEAKGSGDERVTPVFDSESSVEELAAFYVRYGIASGVHHAEQLIRDIRAEAVAQVRTPGSKAL